MTALEETVSEWATRQIGADGLAQVNCCAARIAPGDVAIYRVETPCQTEVSPNGRLLIVGLVYRYEALCPACAGKQRGGEVFTE